jgi:glycosyltransferase involved in cell wall biosynthesis
LLQQQGRDVDLIVCGTVFPGYEWYEEELRERAARPDLAGHVELAGYVHPTWPVLADADLVLVPSRVEPFGNAAVEGLLARRPVIASGVQGLAEVIVADRTGLLVEPGDATALATAIGALLDDPVRASELATAGHADAEERFSLSRYRAQVVAALQRVRKH